MLAGLRIVELATYVAAPGAGGVLADWGADVLKVEQPGGDVGRKFFGDENDALNPMFALDNRGKRSIVIDYARPEGREALLRLLAGADVFLTNVRPGALKRARLDFDSLHTELPRLIYASVTGYGLQGPDAGKPGFDIAAFWARAGVGAITVPKGQEPFPIRTAMGDHVCSLATVSAILAAVVERTRTGEGRLVETSLLRTGVYAIGSDVAVQLKYGKLASTKSRREALNPISNFFQTREGRWVCLVPRQGERDVQAVCRAVGRSDLLDDERFSRRNRRANAALMVTALDEAFGALPYEEVAARLDAEDVPWAPMQTPAQLSDDPQVEAAGCLVDVPDGQGGSFRAPAAPARFGGVDVRPQGPPPQLGEHTDALLQDAGYSTDEIAALRAAGAVA
jgi:crotonobetainyl-CoA:carnitine CoA-transferase CaiB-like acyl-CoA transferase